MATKTETFNSGSGNWYAPNGVANVVVEGIGAGGAGANRNSNGSGGGGKGGAYAKLNAFSAVAGTNYAYSIGVGGNTNNNSNGTNTTFNTSSLLAAGGVTAGRNNATGQTTHVTSSVGDTVRDGGNGADGGAPNANNGGGGGSSAGNNANGLAGVGNNGGGNGQGTLPGNAGRGGNGAKTGSAVGSAGVFPGGAGGGSTRNSATNRNGGNGANGQLMVTYDYTPNAITLTSVGTYGKINNFASIDALTDGQITVEGWFKQGADGNNYMPAFAQDNGGTTSPLEFCTENSAPSEGINFGYDYDGGTNADGYASGGVFLVGIWCHVAVVATTSAKTKVYLNGVEISYNLQQTPVGNPISEDGVNFYIGVWADFSNYWHGDIGGFLRVWSTVRTAQQLLDNKNLLLDASKETGLIVNCNFSEGSGTTVANQASPGNDMALTGTPAWTSGPATSSKSYGTAYQPRNAFVNFQDPGLL